MHALLDTIGASLAGLRLLDVAAVSCVLLLIRL